MGTVLQSHKRGLAGFCSNLKILGFQTNLSEPCQKPISLILFPTPACTIRGSLAFLFEVFFETCALLVSQVPGLWIHRLVRLAAGHNSLYCNAIVEPSASLTLGLFYFRSSVSTATPSSLGKPCHLPCNFMYLYVSLLSRIQQKSPLSQWLATWWLHPCHGFLCPEPMN